MDINDSLTRREKKILGMIAEGKSSKEIARHLGLSVHTVNNHRKHICKKLDLHSTAALVAFAVGNATHVSDEPKRMPSSQTSSSVLPISSSDL